MVINISKHQSACFSDSKLYQCGTAAGRSPLETCPPPESAGWLTPQS